MGKTSNNHLRQANPVVCELSENDCSVETLEMANSDHTHAYYSAWAQHMTQKLNAEPTPQLLEIMAALKACTMNHTVLEVACGTGYWTRHIGPVSSHPVVTDFSCEMIAITCGQKN